MAALGDVVVVGEHGSSRWFRLCTLHYVLQASDPHHAGDPQVPSIHPSIQHSSRQSSPVQWCRERAAPPSSVVPLFKGFSSCDWPIAHELRCLAVLGAGSCPWQQHSMGAHENKNPSQQWTSTRGGDSVGGRRQVNECVVSTLTTGTALTKTSREGLGSSPANAPIKPTLAIQLGSPFVCFVLPLSCVAVLL